MLELFKLLGTIAVDNKEAVDALNETSESGEKTHSKLGGAFSKIGSAAKVCGKVVAAGLAAGATAMGALVKKSLDSYSEYEQLVGGVETLFNETSLSLEDYAASVGKSTKEAFREWSDLTSGARFVMNNAEEAFRTAGLSANEYMETVTSFSASLLQSLSGDTDKAAAYADMAIRDMSDNANKMGTDMSMIQNAYQGFAKQNYTMLDNLKLGYGGTKEEMQRLLVDAAKISGIQYDISSYADIVDAIHVVQTEMGITGTTEREASETIQGSLAATKAAWQNLLTAFGTEDDELERWFDYFIESAVTFAGNIGKRLKIILPNLVYGLKSLITSLLPEIPPLLQDLFPALIEGSVALVGGLVQMIPQILGILFNTVKTLFADNFGSVYSKVESGFKTMWMVMQTIWNKVGKPIFDMISNIVESVRQAFESKMSDIQGFVGSAFSDIQDFWENNLKPCLDAIGTFINETLAPIVQTFFNSYFVGWVDNAFNAVKTLWEDTLKPIFVGITDFLTGVFTGDWKKAWEGVLGVLKGIVNGIITAIETMINTAINAINALIESINDLAVVEAIAEIFGIDGLPTIPNVSFPRLEKGGILEKGQIGFLEGNGAEAVVPLEKNRAWIGAVAKDMKAAFGANGVMPSAGNGMENLLLTVERMIDAQTDALVKAVASLQESGTIKVEDPTKLFKLVRQEQRKFRLATGEGGL